DRLDCVEHTGTPCHRTRVPVLEQAPRDQDHRIVVVGRIVALRELRGREARPAVPRRERLGEDDLVAGIALVAAWIRHGMLALEPFPRDACTARHCLADLAPYVGGTGVIPVEPHAACDLLDQLEVLANANGHFERLASELDPP